MKSPGITGSAYAHTWLLGSRRRAAERRSRELRDPMFDFDELDESLPASRGGPSASGPTVPATVPRTVPTVPTATPAPTPAPDAVAPPKSGGPPSLESLIDDATSSDEADVAEVPAVELAPSTTRTAEPAEAIATSRPAAAAGPMSSTSRVPTLGPPRLARRLQVPSVPSVRGSMLPADDDLLQWMAQKSYLGQDMFLVGDPGPHLRNAALRFAAQTGREVEYIGITRDTTEADLKQRREILDGQLASRLRRAMK